MNKHMITETQIRSRAYELFVERGEQPGLDWDDWLAAERQLMEWANHDRAGSSAFVVTRPDGGKSLVGFVREAMFSVQMPYRT
jgi:hypothetical protein